MPRYQESKTMGAQLSVYRIPDCPRHELKAKFAEIKAECEHMDGHGGYTGTLAEKSALKITGRVFDTDDEAEEYLEDTDKWSPAEAVRVNEPTPHWVIGGNCSS
jgi:hypothetical protein